MLAIAGSRVLLTGSAGWGRGRRIDGLDTGLRSAVGVLKGRLGSGIDLAGAVAHTRTDSISYVDWTSTFSIAQERADLSLTVGARAGDLDDDPWVQLAGRVAVGHRVSLEAAAGRYPRDFIGFSDGTFASIGLRIELGRSSGAIRVPESAFKKEPAADGRWRITFTLADSVTRAEVAADWNGWTPEPLVRSGRSWSTVVTLQPGTYQFSLVIDGTEWRVPEGIPWVPDDFGGRVGLLVITSP